MANRKKNVALASLIENSTEASTGELTDDPEPSAIHISDTDMEKMESIKLANLHQDKPDQGDAEVPHDLRTEASESKEENPLPEDVTEKKLTSAEASGDAKSSGKEVVSEMQSSQSEATAEPCQEETKRPAQRSRATKSREMSIHSLKICELTKQQLRRVEENRLREQSENCSNLMNEEEKRTLEAEMRQRQMWEAFQEHSKDLCATVLNLDDLQAELKRKEMQRMKRQELMDLWFEICGLSEHLSSVYKDFPNKAFLPEEAHGILPAIEMGKSHIEKEISALDDSTELDSLLEYVYQQHELMVQSQDDLNACIEEARRRAQAAVKLSILTRWRPASPLVPNLAFCGTVNDMRRAHCHTVTGTSIRASPGSIMHIAAGARAHPIVWPTIGAFTEATTGTTLQTNTGCTAQTTNGACGARAEASAGLAACASTSASGGSAASHGSASDSQEDEAEEAGPLYTWTSARRRLEREEKMMVILMSTPQNEHYAFQLRQLVLTVIGSISGLEVAHLKEKLALLSTLATGQYVVTSNGDLLSTHFAPLAPLFCNHLIARTVVKKGEEEVAAHPMLAFPLAALAVGISSQQAEVGQLLLCYFYQLCPYLIPFCPQRQRHQTSQSFLRHLGYRVVDSVLEPEESFLQRMSGLVRLYAAIMVSPLPKGKGPLLGLDQGWKWLSEIVHQKPIKDISAILIYEVLQVTGHALLPLYGTEFIRLIEALSTDYLPHLERQDRFSARAYRLKCFLELAQSNQCHIPEPEGLLPRDILL